MGFAVFIGQYGLYTMNGLRKMFAEAPLHTVQKWFNLYEGDSVEALFKIVVGKQFLRVMYDGSACEWMAMIFPAVLLCPAFSERTINWKICQNFKRREIFISKCTVYYLTVLIFLIVYMAILLFLWCSGFFRLYTASYIFRSAAISLWLQISAFHLTFLIGMLLKRPIPALSVSFLSFLTLMFLSRLEVHSWVNRVLKGIVSLLAPCYLLTNMDLWESHIPSELLTEVILFPAISLAVSILLGYFLFKRAELK